MYQQFAHVYDAFMKTIPTNTWADYMETLWKKHDCSPSLVLDLACGTGSLTIEMARRGYDMIGADNSPDMLNQAREKMLEEGMEEKVLFLMQDMREFELYGTVDSIICTCDSLNYLLEEEEVQTVFDLAENYLDVGGLLIFDVNTEYKYREILGDNVFADTTEEAAFIWQNQYYPDDRINEYNVTFFAKKEEEKPQGTARSLMDKLHLKRQVLPVEDSYERFEEHHLQKAYDIQLIRTMLEKAHLKVEGVYDAFTLEEAGDTSERVTFVAREQRKVAGDPAFRKGE